MAEIDCVLRESNIPIHARSMHAGLNYSRRFKLEFSMATSSMTGTPGNYSDANVDAHIRDWFVERYGERLKISIGPGYVAVLIKGDPWRVRLPRIYGQVNCVVDRDLSKFIDDSPFGTAGALPVVNVLSIIEDFPESLAQQLSDAECQHVLQTFFGLLECMTAIEYFRDAPYWSEIRADISAAVGHLFAIPPHAGQSKWASCQAAEKLIKSLLKLRSVPFPKSHDLAELAKLANSVGLRLGTPLLASVSAPPAVRYGEVAVSIRAAVDAHHAALVIGKHISAVARGTA